MMHGGAIDEPTHTVELINQRHSAQFNARAVDYRVRLQSVEGKTYQQICNNFQERLKIILDDVLLASKPIDMVRFNVTSGQFNGHNINTRFQERSQIAPDYIASIIDHTLQSNRTMNMADDFILNIIHVDIPEGSGTKRRLDPNMGMNLVRKKCVIMGMYDWFTDETRDDGIFCFAYALALRLKLLTETYADVRRWSKRILDVRAEVSRLHDLAGIPLGPVSSHHFQAFQDILPHDIRLVVVSALNSKKLLFKGNPGCSQVVPLLHCDNHFLPLTKLKSWFGATYYCLNCEKHSNAKNQHVCPEDRRCRKCNGQRCEHHTKLIKYCKTCAGMFNNPECYDDHVTNSVCEQSKSCEGCGRWFMGPVEVHECHGVVCGYCSKYHPIGNECFITPSLRVSKPKFRYVFYDFETYQDVPRVNQIGRTHVPNYAVAMSYCSNCKDVPCCQCKQTHVFSGLDGDDVLKEFCLWATSNDLNRNTTFIAHNAKGYDSHLILNYLVAEGNEPRLTLQGGKILCLELKGWNIKFIDSLSFLCMPLSNFSATFNLPLVTKGTFPHSFNKPQNYNYVGKLPDLEHFEPDSLKPKQRADLLEWHAAHKNDPFNFREEIRKYCIADVQLLKLGCLIFRSDFLKCTSVDPFQQLTISSTCMEVYRRQYLSQNTIGE